MFYTSVSFGAQLLKVLRKWLTCEFIWIKGKESLKVKITFSGMVLESEQPISVFLH